jgi:hypothetical protein
MTSHIELVQEAISNLKNCTRTVNQPVNMDGLIAAHFCIHYCPEDTDGWIVYESPSKWITETEISSDQAPYMSILGCLIANEVATNKTIDSETIQIFEDSLDRLKQRKEIFQNPTSWIFHPSTVLGVAIGIRAINSDPLKQWLKAMVIDGIKYHRSTLFQKMIYAYCASLLGEAAVLNLPEDWTNYSLHELGFAILLVNRGILLPKKPNWLEEANSKAVELLLTESISGKENDFRYCVLLDVVLSYIITRSHLPSDEILIKVLKGFEPSMERWQYDWPIKNEYHIQAILWLMLRPYFDDIRYEENLPKLGRSGHRYDLGIPSLGKLVEVKYIRKQDDFQKIVNEVGTDSAQITTQNQFREFVVFVYDSTCAVENHHWLKQNLLGFAPVKGAIIVSAPSMAQNQKIPGS